MAFIDESGLPLGREFRLFLVDGQVVAAGRYWDEVDYDGVPSFAAFETLARTIPSRFISMDVALTAAGEWIVIEVGDGQVSGLPSSFDPKAFFQALQTRLS